MSEPLRRGQRVMTPLGAGGVAYTRMAPPQFDVPEAVSVVLDARKTDINYTGTMFRAEAVAPLDPELAALHPIDPRD